MVRYHFAALALVVLIAGCAAPVAQNSPGERDIGTVENVSYDEQLAFDSTANLTDEELDRLVKRSMARIEVVRDLDFNKTVEIRVRTQSDYLADQTERNQSQERALMTNQFWEALFIVGEDRDAATVRDETFQSAVLGYYQSSNERITLITQENSSGINTRTLVHELVHALQDQQFGFDWNASTHDEHRAVEGLVEGEAVRVTSLYRSRCGVVWSCLTQDTRSTSTPDGEPAIRAIYVQPYLTGPDFVEERRADGGWEAINSAHENPPWSTQQVLRPHLYPADEPTNVTVRDQSTDVWSRDAEPSRDTIGEAGLYTMLAFGGVISVDDRLDYRHDFTAGWQGDTLVPYSSDDGDQGYVWETAWSDREAADRFASAYQSLLDSQGAMERGDNVFVISDGPYADAFRVSVDGSRVRIVNGPTVDSLSAIHEP